MDPNETCCIYCNQVKQTHSTSDSPLVMQKAMEINHHEDKKCFFSWCSSGAAKIHEVHCVLCQQLKKGYLNYGPLSYTLQKEDSSTRFAMTARPHFSTAKTGDVNIFKKYRHSFSSDSNMHSRLYDQHLDSKPRTMTNLEFGNQSNKRGLVPPVSSTKIIIDRLPRSTDNPEILLALNVALSRNPSPFVAVKRPWKSYKKIEAVGLFVKPSFVLGASITGHLVFRYSFSSLYPALSCGSTQDLCSNLRKLGAIQGQERSSDSSRLLNEVFDPDNQLVARQISDITRNTAYNSTLWTIVTAVLYFGLKIRELYRTTSRVPGIIARKKLNRLPKTCQLPQTVLSIQLWSDDRNTVRSFFSVIFILCGLYLIIYWSDDIHTVTDWWGTPFKSGSRRLSYQKLDGLPIFFSVDSPKLHIKSEQANGYWSDDMNIGTYRGISKSLPTGLSYQTCHSIPISFSVDPPKVHTKSEPANGLIPNFPCGSSESGSKSFLCQEWNSISYKRVSSWADLMIILFCFWSNFFVILYNFQLVKEFKLEKQLWMTKIRNSSAGGYLFSLKETRKSRKKMNGGSSERDRAPMSHHVAQSLVSFCFVFHFQDLLTFQ